MEMDGDEDEDEDEDEMAMMATEENKSNRQKTEQDPAELSILCFRPSSIRTSAIPRPRPHPLQLVQTHSPYRTCSFSHLDSPIYSSLL
ncbi:hypothetical protein TWF718_001005 [Orbilia javanica]|uniref:Uncharacterized protein n=1 Tax=Orbilia javanica TaxID=47235 RepID=A0AAN8P234_9PEZI